MGITFPFFRIPSLLDPLRMQQALDGTLILPFPQGNIPVELGVGGSVGAVAEHMTPLRRKFFAAGESPNQAAAVSEEEVTTPYHQVFGKIDRLERELRDVSDRLAAAEDPQSLAAEVENFRERVRQLRRELLEMEAKTMEAKVFVGNVIGLWLAYGDMRQIWLALEDLWLERTKLENFASYLEEAETVDEFLRAWRKGAPLFQTPLNQMDNAASLLESLKEVVKKKMGEWAEGGLLLSAYELWSELLITENTPRSPNAGEKNIFGDLFSEWLVENGRVSKDDLEKIEKLDHIREEPWDVSFLKWIFAFWCEPLERKTPNFGGNFWKNILRIVSDLRIRALTNGDENDLKVARSLVESERLLNQKPQRPGTFGHALFYETLIGKKYVGRALQAKLKRLEFRVQAGDRWDRSWVEPSPLSLDHGLTSISAGPQNLDIWVTFEPLPLFPFLAGRFPPIAKRLGDIRTTKENYLAVGMACVSEVADSREFGPSLILLLREHQRAVIEWWLANQQLFRSPSRKKPYHFRGQENDEASELTLYQRGWEVIEREFPALVDLIKFLESVSPLSEIEVGFLGEGYGVLREVALQEIPPIEGAFRLVTLAERYPSIFQPKL